MQPQISFTKFYNDEQVQMAFPTPMGLPFLYSYTRPILVHVNGKAHMHTQPDITSGSFNSMNMPYQFNMSMDANATYVHYIFFNNFKIFIIEKLIKSLLIIDKLISSLA